MRYACDSWWRTGSCEDCSRCLAPICGADALACTRQTQSFSARDRATRRRLSRAADTLSAHRAVRRAHLSVRADGVIERPAGPEGVEPEADLAVRAAQVLKAAIGTALGVSIQVRKRIPVGGGLGGGSSDAATVLLALNELWGCGLSLGELAALGLPLGADVPVFIGGSSAWGEGLGERLTAVTLPEAGTSSCIRGHRKHGRRVPEP